MIYIASPFFDKDGKQLANVKRVETILSNYMLDFFSPRLHGVNVRELPEAERKSGATVEKVFRGNIDAMCNSTFMLACVDGKDQGTNFELGYFYRMNNIVGLRCNSIVTWSGEDAKSNLMIGQATGGHCATIEQLEAFIKWCRERFDGTTLRRENWRSAVRQYQGFDKLDLEEK